MLEPTAQLALTRLCTTAGLTAIVPLPVIVPPVSPEPAVMLVTVPPVTPQPESRKLCTAAGVLRVPLPSAMPYVVNRPTQTSSPQCPSSALHCVKLGTARHAQT